MLKRRSFHAAQREGYHCGYPEVVHGGIVRRPGRVYGIETRAPWDVLCYRQLTVRIWTAPAVEGLLVRAAVTKSSKRIAYTEAELKDETGKMFARAEGVFMPISAEETLAVDDGLIYHGNEERLFDHLRASQNDQ